MAKTAPVVLTQNINISDTQRATSFNHSTDSSSINCQEHSISAPDDEIPTIDYSMIFSGDVDQRPKALQYLAYVCEEYGFFYLINHGLPDNVIDKALKGVSEFFNLTEEEKLEYEKKDSADRIRWGLGFSPGDHEAVKREYLKVLPHPKFEGPDKPAGFSKSLEDYYQRDREVMINLAKAVSKTLGFEENYLEKELGLEIGADVSAMNVYPPWFKSNTPIGLPAHHDPGYLVSLVQNVNGGLQLHYKQKWINVHLPSNSIFVNIGDHLEVLTNGKYKSPMHRVILNNKVTRVSVATVHGPSHNTFVKPASEFVDESHPPKYRGMIYKDSLEANGYHEIDGKSCLQQLRI
ncbi:2-oxoglutarate-dependent dioxygenase 19 [Pyrus x bretschneideri]|uniref:2-oxoglutarate-dependent dioxygenase 19 n=1 Tax=Pyrus x bretschneideri TaxID=225117 RepID=UPI000511AB78|nr:2-oxoglutarate-dependent dioxygenase 19 [Pyrus x bretschneideri]